MKRMKFNVLIMLVLLFLGSTAINAQQGKRQFMGLQGLTEEQKAQITKLRLPHMKEMQDLRNQIRENRAHFRTLMTVDKPDINVINKNIDEFSALKTDMMKKQAAHRQEIRKLLNDEQRLIFDNRMNKLGNGFRSGGFRKAGGFRKGQDEKAPNADWQKDKHYYMGEGHE